MLTILRDEIMTSRIKHCLVWVIENEGQRRSGGEDGEVEEEQRRVGEGMGRWGRGREGVGEGRGRWGRGWGGGGGDGEVGEGMGR